MNDLQQIVAEARSEFRDSDAAGDVLDWIEERIESATTRAEGEVARKHVYFKAGESDCPPEIRAPNGELWKLRCRTCGQDNPKGPCTTPTERTTQRGGEVEEGALTAAQLADWLDAKYRRHGEDEDRQAATMLRAIAATPQAQESKPKTAREWADLLMHGAINCGALYPGQMIDLAILLRGMDPQAQEGMMLDPTDIELIMWPEKKGGMKVGMETGVIVHHRPSKLAVGCRSERSQHKNRDIALAKLAAMLAAAPTATEGSSHE